MKVLLVNGSPHQHGCTYTALCEIADTLKIEGIESEQINKYFLHAQMPVIPSRYWNMVHGAAPEQVREDKEGMQIMRTLARNMAWFLNCKEIGMKHGISFPLREERISTNFIR
ncbi:NAD(P)H-dependent oxidoreductase [Lacrimispora amygdalina]|uniref:NAD(P)H-dependent oxidoreductase n=1 Tax=Lacrimispora amygdalina TaxID=253257 RepID=UPI000BE36328|nr:hypothetical protein [Lacrimispora amygdalina]